jgi:L-alanine-DL-glutamate epimerase-like enolase superfamily enzyme
LTLSTEILTLHPRHPFITARAARTEYEVVLVRLRDADGTEGYGEAYPSPYYGESVAGVQAALQAAAGALPVDVFDLEGAEARFRQVAAGSAAARSALSMALHDLVGKKLGQPLWRLWGLDPRRAPLSSFTIGIDELEKVRAKVREAGEYALYKIKLGTDRDEALLRTVREVTDKPLRVDANAGWTRERALAMLPVLRDYGVELLEQPLPPDDLDGLAAVRRASPGIPVVVDESCLVATDIPKVAGAVDGINIKLAKCGSLREALRMIATARAHGLLVMVGCMIESSVAITAAAHLTPLVDFADLDGAALTVDDPFVGASIAGGRITLPTGPGRDDRGDDRLVEVPPGGVAGFADDGLEPGDGQPGRGGRAGLRVMR